MPQRFSCWEGGGKLVWKGAGGKLVNVEYGAREWVSPDLEGGVWVPQAGFLDSCAQHLSPIMQAAPVLLGRLLPMKGDIAARNGP